MCVVWYVHHDILMYINAICHGKVTKSVDVSLSICRMSISFILIAQVIYLGLGMK